MYTFYVNDKEYQVEKDGKLLPFLRDTCKLKSVKDGCSEGACGTCHVLIDGVATKACVPKLSKLEGKHILTIEGFSEKEREMFVYAFGQAGAVQCGFCIPGMVICAKGLLDKNDHPTRQEIAHALRNNICRCTGYKKIIDAVEIAAQIKRNGGEIPENVEDWGFGQPVHRIDVREKVLGEGEYTDDIDLPGMLHGRVLRSEYPRALVKDIRTEKALALPGVAAVYTAADVLGKVRIGHLVQDWDAFIAIGQETRYLGDAIALVIADTPETAELAKTLIEVDYEERKPVTTPFEAMAEDAPLIHETGNLMNHQFIHRGDAKKAIEQSKYVVSGKFETPWTEHAFLEPECAVAVPREDGGVMVYSSDQGVYATLHETMDFLGLGDDMIAVENKLVGGGFGGKEDVTVQHYAAMGAYLLRKPVKVKLSRRESIVVHPKRHPMWMDFTIGCDENGIIQGVKATVIADTGAYASLCRPVLQRACTHAAGPYNYQNFEIDGKAYYTNNPPAGAFRGFGVTQTCFAMESLLTLMAEKVGISPWEIRYRNAVRPGQVMPNGQIADPYVGIAETLEAVKDVFESSKYAGIACCMKNNGIGMGVPDAGRCRLMVEDGKVHIQSGASCIGQGLGTALTQMVAEETGLSGEDIVYHASNTVLAPNSGTTSGSRQTLITGEATRRAAEKLREALAGHTLDELNGTDYYGEYIAETDRADSGLENPASHVAYGFATQVCILNEDGTVAKIVAAHDVGKAVNPKALEGQIEGGVVMSLGFALTERYPLENGVPKAKFGSLGLFKADKTPDVESIIIEKPGLPFAHGAIGVGEITSIPTAPAIAGAYYRLTGEFQHTLPLKNTPYARKGK